MSRICSLSLVQKGTAFSVSRLAGKGKKTWIHFLCRHKQCASCINDKLIRTALRVSHSHTQFTHTHLLNLTWRLLLNCELDRVHGHQVCDVLSSSSSYISEPNIKWRKICWKSFMFVVYTCTTIIIVPMCQMQYKSLKWQMDNGTHLQSAHIYNTHTR